MSTIPRSRRPSPRTDPFFYGWRDIYTLDERGRRERTRLPLTRYDVLHPQEGDHIVQNDVHNWICWYLQGAFRAATRERPEVQVFADLGIVWSIPGLEGGHCPDVMVVVGARRRRRRPRYYLAVEEVRPELLIEVTSPATRNIDLRDKRRHYYRAGVPYYVIVDDEEEDQDEPPRLRLLGYQRGARGYRQMRLNGEGRLWLETVGVWLGIEGERVVCYDSTGEPLRDLPGETQARIDAEARVRQLEAELKQLRGEE